MTRASGGPRRETLLDFFDDLTGFAGTFIVHDDGYRTRAATYRQVGIAAKAFARRLIAAGVGSGDKVVIWSENRTEWIVAQWGCLLARAVVVPVDYRASTDLVQRIVRIVNAPIILVGHEVDITAELGAEQWQLADVAAIDRAEPAAAATATISGTPAVQGSTLAEIIFTSGATADPKGVMITHANLLANIVPIEREIRKYRRYGRPFQPIRFLNLLPLSHMFGQSMATFVPPMISGTVVFSHGFSPTEIIRQISSRRVSVLVCVPKVLSVLREYIERVEPKTVGPDPLTDKHWSRRWWHYRAVRRRFGWKFWCIVCGAAPLDPELETFWRKLGFLVIQGYGLTETAPVVTLNHPFRASKGTVGKPISGVEVRIADDGEILVRGENVTSGYFVPEEGSQDSPAVAEAPAQSAVFEGGWFHTGDIGEFDDDGRLRIKGRKKEMIVTPQGLNVFPEDVERALLAQPGVIDAGVFGLSINGEERVHAALVLRDGIDLDAVVRGANTGLQDHQRVWQALRWPSGALPRTEGTQKLKRRELQRWAGGDVAAATASQARATTVAGVVARFAAGRSIAGATTLDDLGLGSLDRVELMMALEETFGVTLDETALTGARSISQIEALLAPAAVALAPETAGIVPATGRSESSQSASEPRTPIVFPAWNRSGPSWLIRRLSLPTWILPLGRLFMKMEVRGLEHLSRVDGPVLFAANHQSHLDTPAILLALPPRWRYRLAPAMAKEFFKAHFFPADHPFKARLTNSLNYYLACQFFGAFPLPQRESGTRETLRYLGEVASDGYSVLIFPEGKRTQDGAIGRFMPGVGMIGAKLDLPVIPVRLSGLELVLHQRMKFPVRGRVRVTFGAPLRLGGPDYAAEAKQVEDAVRAL